MAVAPLFVADMDTLKSRLRLSGVPSSGDATSAIEAAVLETRTNFYRRLGGTTVAALVAITSTDTPTTEDEVRRTVAESCEVKWAWMALSRTMPVLFEDGSGNRDEVYNDEGAFRRAGMSQLVDQRRAYALEIEQAMDFLAGVKALGDEVKIRISNIESDCDRPWPGHTIDPRWDPEECES